VRRSARIAWWTSYGVGAAVVLAGLGWTTQRVLRLEREEAVARADAERQETMRLALWRLDSWLTPRFARESARGWFEYEPYHPQTMAVNRLLEPIGEGEVLVPSPLLAASSRWFPLHFQWRTATGFTSPQVPDQRLVAMESIACSPVPQDPGATRRLAEFTAATDPGALLARIGEAEKLFDVGEIERTLRAQTAPSGSQQWVASPSPVSQRIAKGADPADLKARASASNYAQKAFAEEVANQFASPPEPSPQQAQALDPKVPPPPQTVGPAATPPIEIGSLVPLWVRRDPATLVLARRLRFGDETAVQGFVVDWPGLRSELLRQVEDIAPEASIEPVWEPAWGSTEPTGAAAMRLASLPATLVLGPGAGGETARVAHPAAFGLGLVWIAAFGAIAATGLALRASIASAVRTSRFASSVTHELRTPLTTFRLYSELLADGMVSDPERIRTYLATLRDESARLGVIVENVLAWSRAEDGRSPAEPRPIAVDALVDEVTPVLRRRCQEGGTSFEESIERGVGPLVRTDPDRVRQILFNLVDNACKYAGPKATVRLSVGRAGDWLRLAVDDSGPGVPESQRKRVFRAFDRGDRGPGDAVRGLGLGLAISDELARSLGGRLACDRGALGGASFVLDLPL
jgi:signal transduction histidine kinase